MATYTPQQLGINVSGYGDGAWIQGRHLWGGTLSEKGQIHPSSNQPGAGQAVSAEVNAQSASQQGVSVQQFDQFLSNVNAKNLTSATGVPTTSGANSQYFTGLTEQLNQARNALNTNLTDQAKKNTVELEAAKKKETEALGEVDKLTTPFREDLEKTERERLGTDTVLAQQKELLGELDQLLTEGNDLIRQQKEVTGLAAVRNPRIQKTMEDITARAGVIEAVVSLQNTYLANAYHSIDRTSTAISQDRQDRLNYYNAVLSLANRDIIELTANDRRIAQEQTNLLKFDLENAQKTVDYVKELMINPATALLMSQSGVSLNDSVEIINAKMAKAQYANEVRTMANQITVAGGVAIVDPNSVPADQLKSFTDSQGQVHYYKIPKTGTGTGNATASGYLGTLTPTPADKSKGATPKADKSPAEMGIYGPWQAGAIWVNPQTATMWQYTSSKQWKRVG